MIRSATPSDAARLPDLWRAAGLRGRGIAAALLAELERRLIALGCPKVNLLIEPDNAAVAGFYARFGYQPDELLFMEKWLLPPSGPISIIPNAVAQLPGPFLVTGGQSPDQRSLT